MATLLRRNKVGYRLLSPKKNEKILDIGCSSGYLVDAIDEKAQGFGIDIELGLIKKGKNKKLVNANAMKMPFKNESFDKIICLDTLEHVYGFRNNIEDVNKIIKECQRVLKKGGNLIISVPYKSPLIIFDLMWWKGLFTGHHHKHFSEKELRNLLRGFKIIKINKHGSFFTEWARIMFQLRKIPLSKYIITNNYLKGLKIKSEKEYEKNMRVASNVFILTKKL